jgi:succinate dehydrogenase/fumarate reductase flavoprotein subunit
MKLIVRRMLFGVPAVLFLGACGAWAQGGAYPDARQLVQHVQEDLRRIMQEDARNHKQADHCEDALKHLSDLDKGLANNRFDKDRLDAAVDHMKKVLDDNTIEARDRDMLTTDIEDLRHLRVDRGNM